MISGLANGANALGLRLLVLGQEYGRVAYAELGFAHCAVLFTFIHVIDFATRAENVYGTRVLNILVGFLHVYLPN